MSDACSPSECDHTTVFVSAESSSFTTDGESVIANFAGHSSYQGDWATDQVALGGWSLPEYEFGLVNRTVNETAAPSLLGLAWSDSTDTIKSVSYIWATDGTWADPQFGVYLTRPRYASAGSQINGSLLTFG